MSNNPSAGRATKSVEPHIEDDARAHPTSGALRAVLNPAGVVLTIGLIFVTVYLAAFHAPTPHHLPIAAAGSSDSVESITRGLDGQLPGGFQVTPMPTAAAALNAVTHRQAFGAVVISGRQATLSYSGANGPAVTTLLTNSVGVATRLAEVSLTTRDILPGTPGDSRDLSVFYTSFGLVLAGFLFGSVTYQTAPRMQLRRRLLSLATFAVAGGILITLVAESFSALPGPFLAVAGVIALMAAAAASASMMFVRLLGGAGVSLGSVVLLVLGNSTSGGSLPTDFLPAWLYPLSKILPVGVGVRALDGLAYFHHDGLLTAVLVLSAWIVGSVAVLVLRDELDARHQAQASAVAPAVAGQHDRDKHDTRHRAQASAVGVAPAAAGRQAAVERPVGPTASALAVPIYAGFPNSDRPTPNDREINR